MHFHLEVYSSDSKKSILRGHLGAFHLDVSSSGFQQNLLRGHLNDLLLWELMARAPKEHVEIAIWQRIIAFENKHLSVLFTRALDIEWLGFPMLLRFYLGFKCLGPKHSTVRGHVITFCP